MVGGLLECDGLVHSVSEAPINGPGHLLDDPSHLRPVVIKPVGRILEVSDSKPTLGYTRKVRKVPLTLVAQCSATPATVPATPPCSATPFQTQISVRHLPGMGGGGATPKSLGGVA